MELKKDVIYVNSDSNYFCKITAIGIKNLCFQYSSDLNDLRNNIGNEDSCTKDEFIQKFFEYAERKHPKEITLYSQIYYDEMSSNYYQTSFSTSLLTDYNGIEILLTESKVVKLP